MYLGLLLHALLEKRDFIDTWTCQLQVAYTFDAGPNAVLFTLDDTVEELVEVVKRSFPPKNNGDQ